MKAESSHKFLRFVAVVIGVVVVLTAAPAAFAIMSTRLDPAARLLGVIGITAWLAIGLGGPAVLWAVANIADDLRTIRNHAPAATDAA